jgi:cathepsin X
MLIPTAGCVVQKVQCQSSLTHTHVNIVLLLYSCMPYIACSSDSTEGFCPFVDTTCSALNTCRTCTPDGQCRAVAQFPNATVAEYGVYQYDVFAMKAEIFLRGPVKASVDAEPLKNYTGGVMWDAPEYESDHHNHVSDVS